MEEWPHPIPGVLGSIPSVAKTHNQNQQTKWQTGLRIKFLGMGDSQESASKRKLTFQIDHVFYVSSNP